MTARHGLALLLAAAAAAGGCAAPAPAALPAATAPAGAERLVFAHYFTPYPLSPDNAPAQEDYYTREYLDPDGEDGRHAAYGGLLRDRPVPVPPGPDASWELANHMTEIRQAQAAGIDGFTANMLAVEGVYADRVASLVRAADELDTGFRIVLMPDAAVLDPEDGDELVDLVGELLAHDSLHRLDDGRLVVAPFHPERFGADWWAGWMADVRDELGVEVALVPCFLDYRASIDDFAPISHGVSRWGDRSPAGSADGLAYARDARERGLRWMQPVSVQDVRPAQGVFDEAGNTEQLRLTVEQAVGSRAEWVQLITWNDYAEGTQIAPSVHHGTALLDAVAVLLQEYRTGRPPTITRDVLVVSHRVHASDAVPARQPELAELREGSSPVRDEVEVLAFLTAPAEVTVRSGGSETRERLPAGVSTTRAPLAPGAVGAVAVRGGAVVASVASPWPVVTDPAVQDLGYRFTTGAPRDPYTGAVTPGR